MPMLDAARPLPTATPLPEIREIGAADLNWALAEGWRDFREKRGDLIFLGLIYPVVCLIAVLFTVNDPLLPLFFPLVAGVSIAGPAVASGFYELARRREEGLDSSWRNFLNPVRGRSRAPLAILTLMLAVLFLAWLGIAYVIYATIFAGLEPMSLSTVFSRLFTTAEGWRLIIIGNLVGLGFAVTTLITGAISFPMVVDQPVDASTALFTSLSVASVNPRAMLGWGVRVAALLALGTIPLGIGLAVVLPWLGYSTWHLYTRAVVR